MHKILKSERRARTRIIKQKRKMRSKEEKKKKKNRVEHLDSSHSVVSADDFKYLSCSITGGFFFFFDRRQEKRWNKITEEKQTDMWQRSCSRFKQRGHPGYTTCIWATRTPQCIALKITLGWETIPAGGNGACLSGKDKKARQRLRLILINETWVSRCRKDLDVIFV